jgi:hypothetical protein
MTWATEGGDVDAAQQHRDEFDVLGVQVFPQLFGDGGLELGPLRADQLGGVEEAHRVAHLAADLRHDQGLEVARPQVAVQLRGLLPLDAVLHRHVHPDLQPFLAARRDGVLTGAAGPGGGAPLGQGHLLQPGVVEHHALNAGDHEAKTLAQRRGLHPAQDVEHHPHVARRDHHKALR